MSTLWPSSTLPLAAPAPGTADTRWAGSGWRAPLVPVALGVTAGIVSDRCFWVPLTASLLAVVAGLAAWASSRGGRHPGLPIIYLIGATAAAGAAYHHAYRNIYPADDVGQFALADARPARLRGILVDEPIHRRVPLDDPLRSMPAVEPTQAVLQVRAYQEIDRWVPASGRVRMVVEGRLDGVHAGDEVEVVGRLVAPQGSANPGAPDPSARLLDQRIRALLLVRKTTDAVTRKSEGWTGSLAGWLGAVRGWGQRRLAEALPGDESDLAQALLLGDGSPLARATWEKYQRTGVVHLLVVSGQHLVVLAIFLWALLRLGGIRQRRSALFVAGFLFAYAVLTGGEPPALRSAVMVCTAAAGLLLCRPVLPANSFALAWLVVAALNPTDMFAAGCQLSFLCVALLFLGIDRWFSQPTDPLQQLVADARPAWQQLALGIGRWIVASYAVTAVLWLAAAPLVAGHYHMVAPVGLLIGPPLTLLMSIALVAGFLLLLAAAIVPPLAPVFALPTRWSLVASDAIVNFGDRLPGACWYVSAVPVWWLWVLYLGLLAALLLPALQPHWRWALPALLAWGCVGLVGGSTRPASDELRCTFLAVGHGGCIVFETPDGRTLLYDAGAIAGPEVTTRHIAPFLWGRGIRRIDEVLLSHADLDHFNGLPALLERFAVGQVSCTPTFTERSAAPVRLTVAMIERHGVPVRIIQAGQRLSAGPVVLEVLHPPAEGPPGKENHRSLVLRVRHQGHSLLLTGDLEGPGLERLLQLPAEPVDVLMAPHHGSQTANTPTLADWARPRLVVSCEGSPRGPLRPPEPYSPRGALFLGTWPHGAITIRSGPAGLVVETYLTKQRFVLSREQPAAKASGG